MNSGIVMIGFALVLLSVGLMVTPSTANVVDIPCSTICGCTDIFQDTSTPGGMAGIGLPSEETATPVRAATSQIVQP